jgi:hypothetical protein
MPLAARMRGRSDSTPNPSTLDKESNVKLLPILAAALLAAAPVAAQNPGGAPAPKQQPKPAEDPLQKKLDEKLKEPFFKKAPWLTDYDQALAESKKSGKPIFGYFSRSYAY